MDTDRTGSRAAQPADEEIKKHGDPLKKHVAGTAGKQMPGSGQAPQDVREDMRDDARKMPDYTKENTQGNM